VIWFGQVDTLWTLCSFRQPI